MIASGLCGGKQQIIRLFYSFDGKAMTRNTMRSRLSHKRLCCVSHKRNVNEMSLPLGAKLITVAMFSNSSNKQARQRLLITYQVPESRAQKQQAMVDCCMQFLWN